ncbi:MAG: phytanoyl-CoA dioxygenase family protein [Myxococcales bacterium]|nr:phytanoyl-CoA dioxygenase family protein [Myxococcales bacterium]
MTDRAAALARDGFVHLPGLLDASDVEAARADLDALQASVAITNHYGRLGHNIWQSAPSLGALVRGGRLARVVAEVLAEPSVVFFQDGLVWKPPGQGERIQWHQDHSYLPLDAPRALTLWLCFDDADEAAGCLWYIPGTHRLGDRRPAEFAAGGGPASDLPPMDVEGRVAVPVPVRAGDAIAHDVRVWHMSEANSTAAHRRALSTTWVTPAATWQPARAASPFTWRLRPRPGAPLAGPLFPRFDQGEP